MSEVSQSTNSVYFKPNLLASKYVHKRSDTQLLHVTLKAFLIQSPVSMIVGHVLTLTLAAASLDLRILMRGCVVRMQAALLTCDTQHRAQTRSFRATD